jgi:hypothetical protein
MDWISLKIPVYACHDPRMKGSGSDGSKEARRMKAGQVRSYIVIIFFNIDYAVKAVKKKAITVLTA